MNIADFGAGFQNTNGYDSYLKVETCPSTSAAACVVTYLEVSGAFTIGGTRVQGVSDVEACKTWCTERDTCGAFDFNLANECYWHNNRDWENRLQEGASGVTQYRKQPCVSPTGTGATGTGGTGM